jgi:LPXTG-site transpeptidase (sortase) family protein
MVLLALGIAAIVAGGALILGPLYGVWHRGQNDNHALASWQHIPNSLAGPASPTPGAVDAGNTPCGSSSANDYALLTFSSPAAYHYAGVSGDGTWDMLNNRSMVHYHGTPDPGQQGNVVIAFHREPNYEHIDQLSTGDTITIQDRACHTFVYKVTGRWDLAPARVTQLAPTGGHDLTLVTCDPWWQDYNRLIWRAALVQPAPAGVAQAAAGGPGTVANPTFSH